MCIPDLQRRSEIFGVLCNFPVVWEHGHFFSREQGMFWGLFSLRERGTPLVLKATMGFINREQRDQGNMLPPLLYNA